MKRQVALGLLAGIFMVGMESMARAHCDTIDGPVAVAGKAALEKGEVKGILQWVKSEGEKEIREAFDKALKVRGMGSEAKELADRYFLETLVRVHRAGEGEPYTGLKAAGEVPAGIALADKAVAGGDVEALVKKVSGEVSEQLRAKYSAVASKKEHAEHTVEAGRAYVAAYVTFIHYVEKLVSAGSAGEHGHEAASPAEHQH